MLVCWARGTGWVACGWRGCAQLASWVTGVRGAAQVFSNLCRAGRLEDALQVAEAAVKARRDDILIR